ncbi:MAG: pyridoxamine 5'-phosphate oxidase family protein [Campylobacteraceae bacterium]|jgi:uncharacterized pyridoxamine 5'-phosphate oxidase family protein|nr:pyridoxamine 5'-phosphate oxidase family protein [Campylobacteraceae bacterium]
MQEIIDFLNAAGAFFVGTVDEKGKPRVRPFSFIMEWEGKLTFVTNNQKDVYKQLNANPYADICAFNSSDEWIRISGKVKFFQNVEANRKVFEIMPMLKEMYTSAENPILVCFSYEEGEAAFYAFRSGNQPFKTIKI